MLLQKESFEAAEKQVLSFFEKTILVNYDFIEINREKSYQGTDPEFWIERRLNTLTGVIHQIFSEEIQPGKYHNYYPADNFLQSILIKKALKNRGGSDDGLLHFNLISENTLNVPSSFLI